MYRIRLVLEQQNPDTKEWIEDETEILNCQSRLSDALDIFNKIEKLSKREENTI